MKLPSVDHMTARLVDTYASAPADVRAAGRRWYREARAAARSAAVGAGISESRAAAIIAALSPRQRWDVNLRSARALIADPDARVPGFGNQVDKARAIRNGARPADVLRGPKERAFWQAISGARDSVTVDRWALTAATGRDYPTGAKLTTRQYERVADAYKRAAARVGVRPREFQAIVWVAARGAAN